MNNVDVFKAIYIGVTNEAEFHNGILLINVLNI